MRYQVLVGLFLLCASACTVVEVETPTITIATPSSLSSTPVPLDPSHTSTWIASLTPSVSPTATTALSIYPSPSPTFDVSRAITRTLSQPAQCPINRPEPALEINGNRENRFIDVEQPVLDFLNSGGTTRAVVESLTPYYREPKEHLLEIDLTGDRIPELIINELWLFVFGCNSGKYRVLLKGQPGYHLPISFSPNIVYVGDTNLNGIPELITSRMDGANYITTMYFQILEWDGSHFQNLITQPDFDSRYGDGGVLNGNIYMDGEGDQCSKGCVQDIDGNGTLEFVLSGGAYRGAAHPNAPYGPWRVKTDVYMWNGEGFVWHSTEFEPPQFRYQAIQDADKAVLDGRIEKALELYRQVIFSDTLDWYSQERRFWQLSHDPFATPPPPLPSPDPNEYPNLAAYAHFRMMLLHLVQSSIAESKSEYDALQAQFPNGSVGYAYAEMAIAFWNDYQETHDISLACREAIAYATLHQDEILTYISGYGWQDRSYKPEDICPFK